MSEKVSQKIEYILLFMTGGISLLVAVLDVSGLMDSSAWISQRLPGITLLCVGFIASYLILERRGQIDRIAKSVDDNGDAILKALSETTSDTIRSLNGVEVQVYRTRKDFLRAVTSKIRTARRIDDLVWSVPSTSGEPVSRQEIEDMDRYGDAIENAIKRSEMVWREVVIFDSKRFKRSKRRILDESAKGFNLGYIDKLLPDDIPRLSFMIIDKEELFLFNLPTERNLRLSVKHPDIVYYFSQYYEALWNASKKIKRGESIDYPLLEKLTTQFPD